MEVTFTLSWVFLSEEIKSFALSRGWEEKIINKKRNMNEDWEYLDDDEFIANPVTANDFVKYYFLNLIANEIWALKKQQIMQQMAMQIEAEVNDSIKNNLSITVE